MVILKQNLVVFAFLSAELFSSKGAAATVTGRVVDTANHPVGGAAVMISEEAVNPSKPPAMKGASAWTAADGSFSFDNLEAGTYQVCAQAPRTNLINPCQGAKTLPQVIVSSPTATSSITLTMRQGYRLPVRVDDPQGLLNAHEGKTPGAHLLIGVHGGYRFEVGDIDTTDNRGRTVSVLVPFDVPVNVTVASRFFKLQDQAGNSANKQTPVAVSSAAPSAKLNIKVVGTN